MNDPLISKEEQARRDEIAKLPHIVLGTTKNGAVATMPVFPGTMPPGSVGEILESGDVELVKEFLGSLDGIITRDASAIIEDWHSLRRTPA